MKQKYKLILASGSPRRKEMLSRNNIEFDIIKSEGPENSKALEVSQYVVEIAEAKGEEVYGKLEQDFSGFILSADTIVAVDNTILGKPVDRDDAIKMIESLSGRSHSVYTGVSIIRVIDGQKVVISFAEETKVYVKALSMQQIVEYVDCGECMDKAGAYAIQGEFGKYIEKFEGDYDNVVGLPFERVNNTLKEFGFYE